MLIAMSPRRSVAGTTTSPSFSFVFALLLHLTGLTARYVLVLPISDPTYKYPIAWPRRKAANYDPLSHTLRVLSDSRPPDRPTSRPTSNSTNNAASHQATSEPVRPFLLAAV